MLLEGRWSEASEEGGARECAKLQQDASEEGGAREGTKLQVHHAREEETSEDVTKAPDLRGEAHDGARSKSKTPGEDHRSQ